MTTWVPRSTPENVRFEQYKLFLKLVFSCLREDKIRKKMSGFRLTSVEAA